MRVNSISNYGCNTPKYSNNKVSSNNTLNSQSVSFTSDDKQKEISKAMKAMRNAGIALMFVTPVITNTSCDKWDDYGYAKAEAHAWAGIGSYVDSTHCTHPTDTIIKWWYNWERPMPLDTLQNNMNNWDIEGAGGDINDSTARRNIIHYVGTREWEYNSKEIGDINVLESSRRVLTYDTEILDYKGNHESYGKRVFRMPSGEFTIKRADGTVLKSPGGLFVEEYENEFDEKGGSILDCKLKSRAFVTTNGDTLNVAKRKGTTEFVEGGKVAKGYLGANSILLRNLIGEYSTDDHYVNFKVEAVEDNKLRAMYVEAMDKKED